MNRSFLYGFVGLVGVAAVGLLPLACSAGGVGSPCTPEDESSFRFPGFKVTEDIIESRSFQCATRICLVNHFQGRASCPLGQPAPKDAQGNEGCTPKRDAKGNYLEGQGSCGLDPNDGKTPQTCMQAGSFSPSCDISLGQDVANKFCSGLGAGGKCNAAGFCECKTDADCSFVTSAVVSCDASSHQCVAYACHTKQQPNGPPTCQDPASDSKTNAGLACCLPGTDTPVTTPVCGQCRGPAHKPTRDAANAVYCSCRCGVAEGDPDDPNFNFCTCPDGFECSEIRKNVGLGDQKITGKYCILAGTAYDPNQDQCNLVDGYWASGSDTGIKCAGVASSQCQTKKGNCVPN